MSLEDLDAYVWGSLGMRKHVAGRALVSRLTRRCVRRWPGQTMLQANAGNQQRIIREIARSVERSERQNYGMGVILTLILSALLSEIVKALLAWWLKSASNRALLVGWQQELQP